MDGLVRRLDFEVGGEAVFLAGGQAMICPTCHGNGYRRAEAVPVSMSDLLDRGSTVEQCPTCASTGEVSDEQMQEGVT